MKIELEKEAEAYAVKSIRASGYSTDGMSDDEVTGAFGEICSYKLALLAFYWNSLLENIAKASGIATLIKKARKWTKS